MPALVDGSPAEHIPLRDRGFLFGDGLFETVRFHGLSIPLWAYHRRRLEKGLQQLGIECDIALIEADMNALLSGVPDSGVLRITITRGDGQGGYASGNASPRRVLEVRDLSAGIDGSVTVRMCDWRLPVQPALAGIKHLNRLDQVMARREWDDDAVFDGLICDASGAVIESTCCNLFIRQGQQWATPDLSRCGVAGVMRAWLMAEGLPALGYAVDVCDITLTRLLHADEVFLCNAVRGVLPVTALAKPQVEWAAGTITQQLQSAVGALWDA